MKQLVDCFESLLDADYDIDDSVILTDLVKKATGCRDHEMPDAKIDGEWIVFDCTKWKVISFQSFAPFKAVGYKKFRFISCKEIIIFSLDDSADPWSDIEIDAPGARVEFHGTSAPLKLTNIILNSRTVYIRPSDSVDAKVVMKGCKFDTAMIDFYTIDQLSIADTCKFTHCKLLFFGEVGKSVARKASNLLMGDISNGQSFKKEMMTWKCADKTKYWDIDVMKTLGLKANKWPDLGKIVIVPVQDIWAGICLYKLSKGAMPASGSPNGEIVEYKDGWRGQHVRYVDMEKNCVAK